MERTFGSCKRKFEQQKDKPERLDTIHGFLWYPSPPNLDQFKFVLFCLDTKKDEKKSSTNTAPLPAAGRLATAPARVGRAVRARPRTVLCIIIDDESIFSFVNNNANQSDKN